MEINTKINNSLETLNAYNKVYSWIPNENQIRPTDFIISLKKVLFDKIFLEYNSTRDYILINIFQTDCDKYNDYDKLIAIEPNDKFNKFEVCRFRYQLDPSTFHYIMWYTCDKNELTDNEISKNIKDSIYNIIKSDNFSFIWYENPKMTITDIYHIQVFWIKN